MRWFDAPVSTVLELIGSDGSLVAGSVRLSRMIPARGKIAGDVGALFGYGGELNAAHVRATCARDALAGFALTRQPGTLFGLNAVPLESAAPVLYSPQLAVGMIGVHFNTRLNLVNVGPSDASVSVQLYDDRGNPLPGVDLPVRDLPRGGHLSMDIESYFRLSGRTVQGSIAVTGSPGAKLIGNVVFGDGNPVTDSLDFAAALPLRGRGETSFVFSQVAQAQGFYTGVAFLAPGGAELQIEVFRQDGTVAGRHSAVLDPGERLVSILEHLIPGTAQQVGGYVKVSCSNPVIAFELFGAQDGEFLSAVPPQRLEH